MQTIIYYETQGNKQIEIKQQETNKNKLFCLCMGKHCLVKDNSSVY